MIFREQLENRDSYNKIALKEAFDALNSVANPNKAHSALQQTKSVLTDILNSLRIKDFDTSMLKGANAENFEDFLKVHHVLFRKVRLKDKWWKDANGPMLALDKQGNFVSLIPAFRGYRWHNPETGVKEAFRAQHFEMIDPMVFCFYRSLPNKPLKVSDLFHFMLQSLDLSDAIYVFISCLAVSLLGMFTPYVNKIIFDDIIPTGIANDIFPIMGLLIGASIGAEMFTITRSLVLTRIKNKVEVALESAVMARTLHLPVGFFRQYTTGDLANRVMGIKIFMELLSDSVMSSFLTLIFSVVYIYQIHLFAPQLLGVSMLIIFTYLVVILFFHFKQQQMQSAYLTVHSKLQGLIFSLFSGIQKIKTSGAEIRAFHKWALSFKEMGHIQYNQYPILRANRAIVTLCTMGSTWLIYYFAIRSGLSLSNYIAFNASLGIITGALLAITGILPFISSMKPTYTLIRPILEANVESEDSGMMVGQLSGQIEITNLSFRYSPESPYIFKGLNLKINPGEFVGIVGHSGCGKSTLFRLLLGFEKPETGSIFYDQYNLEKINKQQLRQQIGTCLQSDRLFAGDIMSNISITAPFATLEDVWEACRLAAVDEDIREMPMTIYTLLSEGDGGLSGGQRQRILMARALINKPPILLLDEATSALDNISQRKVSENIEKTGCTRIAIAHRISTIRNCHRILVLDQGKIAEEGTYDELIAKKGLFYELNKRQL